MFILFFSLIAVEVFFCRVFLRPFENREKHSEPLKKSDLTSIRRFSPLLAHLFHFGLVGSLIPFGTFVDTY